mgnify:CR=1 FL=1|jgi:hypothetical protein
MKLKFTPFLIFQSSLGLGTIGILSGVIVGGTVGIIAGTFGVGLLLLAGYACLVADSPERERLIFDLHLTPSMLTAREAKTLSLWQARAEGIRHPDDNKAISGRFGYNGIAVNFKTPDN